MEAGRGVAGLAYAGIAYLAVVVAMTYLIGFLIGAPLPKNIDDGMPADAAGIALDLVLLALFGAQHSLMARPGFKAAIGRVVPEHAERSTYVVAASAVLGLAMLLWRPLPQVVWNVDGGLAVIAYLVFLGGVVIAAAGTFMINHFHLLGLRQAWFHARGEPLTDVPFQQRALYRYVRHPIMLGLLLMFWATPRMTMGHALFAAGMTVYILVGTWFEERQLRRQLGSVYDDYRAAVPGSIVPWFRSHS
ncbi:MAG: methanethiol S-methyltransferase [Chloroflexota bacterium]|nr:methanethiol S-methyltransferase [Chloroflexota bacterium]